MNESMEQLLKTYPIGSRIRLTDHSIGTLKYVGEVRCVVFLYVVPG